MIKGRLKNAEEFASKKFMGHTMKEAYLKACKWYASNVLASDELKNVLVDYEKVHDEQSPTVVIHLYVTSNQDEVMNHHCQICKETHKAFYINDETNCNWCRLKGYEERCKNSIELKKSYYKELLKGDM